MLFTGSAQNGIAINRKLAVNPGRLCALEMGGNNPIIAWDTPIIADFPAKGKNRHPPRTADGPWIDGHARALPRWCFPGGRICETPMSS